MSFCPTCKSLMQPRMHRGKRIELCPKCDGLAKGASGKAWWVTDKQAPSPRRYEDAVQAAVTAQPKPPPAERRAPSPPKPAEKLVVPEGTAFFPWSTVRAGQREFIADVAATAAAGRHLVADAPTGLGKTASTLAPLVEHALANGKRVFFLTSKQSHHRIAIDTLKAIRAKSGVPFVVADLIAKQAMCPRREARELFPRRFNEFCRRVQVGHTCSFYETKNGPALAVMRKDVMHVEDVVIAATDLGTCPHQAAVDLAGEAHVVVCDYNYFFSDMREHAQARLNIAALSDVLLVVDEAHNLAERIRDHLTLELNEYVLDDAIDELRDVREDRLVKVLDRLKEVVVEMVGESGGAERYVTREELIEAVDHQLSRRTGTLTQSSYQDLVTELELAQDTYIEKTKEEGRGLGVLHRFLSNWKVERKGVARIWKAPESREGGFRSPTVQYKMLDAAVLAKPVFDGVAASVLMSGTLHPPAMTRDILGLDPARTDLREYESPFPKSNRLLVVDAGVTTAYDERSPEMYARIAERLVAIADATPGSVAAFFPSYGVLEDVRVQLPRCSKSLVVESRGESKAEKDRLVRALADGESLLLGVQGGSLSEGYDFDGNVLKALVVVGLPFAAPSLESESLIAFFGSKFGPEIGRRYAYVQPTMNRVVQAAGRCIRSERDRAVVVLMDKRFNWGSYRSLYPRGFQPRIASDVADDVARFWGR
ncbi:MAG: helicase C-terminal domain-containing protein [Thermoplasmatota archaeon]